MLLEEKSSFFTKAKRDSKLTLRQDKYDHKLIIGEISLFINPTMYQINIFYRGM
jgi:hypothetical protein